MLALVFEARGDVLDMVLHLLRLVLKRLQVLVDLLVLLLLAICPVRQPGSVV